MTNKESTNTKRNTFSSHKMQSDTTIVDCKAQVNHMEELFIKAANADKVIKQEK
jgi:hypothetical protein